MAMPEHVPLGEVKNRLSEVVERVERLHQRVVITKHGRPAAVIVSVDDLESLEETLEVMSDPALMADIRAAEAEIAGGEAVPLTEEEAITRFRSR